MWASLLGAVLSGEAVATARRLKTQILVMAGLGVIALLGLMFLILAGYLFAARELGPIAAACWIGGALIVIAVLGFAVYRMGAARRARRVVQQRKAEIGSVAAAAAFAALPALASRKNAAGLILVPFLAVVGYHIYKENTRPSRNNRSEL